MRIYIDREGIHLGQWLSNLPSVRNGTAQNGYKELTDEQIARLDELGMIWENKHEKQWNETFLALCDYYKKYSTFEIPATYTTESGISLGK